MKKSTILTIALIVVLAALAACAYFLFGSSVGGITYADAEKYTVGGTTIASPVEDLIIDWTEGAVNIEYHEGDGIIVSEKADKELSEDNQLRWWLDGKTLRIRYAKAGIRLSFSLNKQLTVSLPDSLALQIADIGSTSGRLNIPYLTADEVRLASTSGDIDAVTVAKNLTASSTSGNMNICQDDDIETVKLDSTSGSIFCALGNVNSVNARSTSGGIQLTSWGEAGDADLRSTSGKIHVDLACVDTLKVQSTSGGFGGNVASFSSLKIDTTAGGVALNLLEEPGFTLKADSASGSFKSGISLKKDGRTYTCGDGSGSISISTSSGNIQIGMIE